MNIGLLGCGVVGGGILDFCAERADLTVAKVLVRRPRPELGALAVTDIADITGDPTIGIVIEVMGGLHPAYEYVAAALRAGKNVVSSNKYLMCRYYDELTALAKEHGAALRCTAAVGGGIPWLVNLERVKRLDSVQSFCGIMNGTTNFILDAMHTNGADFSEVLAEAQRLGYAEADPSADIDGLDIQRKAVISANVAFDACLSEEDVPVFGIRSVSACDIAAAESRERICKMLAFGEKSASGAVSCYVEPCFVPAGELEAAVSTNRNVISFVTELTGRESFYGQGAGRYPTAYNAVADCSDILGGVNEFYTSLVRDVPVDNSAVSHRYYVRFSGSDDFLASVESEKCGEGIITMPVPVAKMHEWAAKAKEADPGVFIAGLI